MPTGTAIPVLESWLDRTLCLCVCVVVFLCVCVSHMRMCDFQHKWTNLNHTLFTPYIWHARQQLMMTAGSKLKKKTILHRSNYSISSIHLRFKVSWEMEEIAF